MENNVKMKILTKSIAMHRQVSSINK